MFFLQCELLYSDNSYSCSRRGATIYYTVYSRHNLLKTDAGVSIYRYIQCLNLMNSEVAWVLVSSGTQVQSQIILDRDYLPDYLSVSYDYVASY